VKGETGVKYSPSWSISCSNDSPSVPCDPPPAIDQLGPGEQPMRDGHDGKAVTCRSCDAVGQ